ncbi:MAG: YggS family pyridoxal phosphate-dependent enzyme, partial [Candidatus Aenigmatarchaeota archaeon]
REAMHCGLRVFGENRVREAIDKWSSLKEHNIELHLIGHLQSNKVKKAVAFFDMIESVDRMKTAEKINNYCKEIGKRMGVLAQVNIGGEETKYGIAPEALMDFVQQLTTLKNIDVRGLMAIAPLVTPEETRPYFRKMKKLFDETQKIRTMGCLSMGMTNDFTVALEEGSNMVRLGRAIFGDYDG